MSVCKGYPGRTIPIYISPLSSDKHTKGSSLGQYLQGTATFAKVIFCIFMFAFFVQNTNKLCSITLLVLKDDFIDKDDSLDPTYFGLLDIIKFSKKMKQIRNFSSVGKKRKSGSGFIFFFMIQNPDLNSVPHQNEMDPSH